MPRWPSVEMTPALLAQAEALRDAGWSRVRIASRLDMSESYLSRHLDPLPSHRTAPRDNPANDAAAQQTIRAVATISSGGEARA